MVYKGASAPRLILFHTTTRSHGYPRHNAIPSRYHDLRPCLASQVLVNEKLVLSVFRANSIITRLRGLTWNLMRVREGYVFASVLLDIRWKNASHRSGRCSKVTAALLQVPLTPSGAQLWKPVPFSYLFFFTVHVPFCVVCHFLSSSSSSFSS